ncbi:MAG: hypothetical protein IJ693_02890 [Bacteroidaceae bacterium]|nr:hypothetical protein [Bacteroidaceae bacterium]
MRETFLKKNGKECEKSSKTKEWGWFLWLRSGVIAENDSIFLLNPNRSLRIIEDNNIC